MALKGRVETGENERMSVVADRVVFGTGAKKDRAEDGYTKVKKIARSLNDSNQ